MIRAAVLLALLTLLGHQYLPRLRAQIADPFYSRCLKFTPQAHHKSEIQSLVCGQSLRDSSNPAQWKNLGLIHILVVSGGHLSLLAIVLTKTLRFLPEVGRLKKQKVDLSTIAVFMILFLFTLANRLQPPVLRALFEWSFRGRLLARGWRFAEISLISTWAALPFCRSTFDLLSLALSFFAATSVELASRALYRRPLLAMIGVQITVWWMLLPLLFTLGQPHPLTSLVNVVLAPLLGGTLIPLAMLAWTSARLPALFGNAADPIFAVRLFDLAWEKSALAIEWLDSILPSASPKIIDQAPLIFGSAPTTSQASTLLIFTLAGFAALFATLIRARRISRRQSVGQPWMRPTIVIGLMLIAAIFVHQQLSKNLAETAKLKLDTACSPCLTTSPRVRN